MMFPQPRRACERTWGTSLVPLTARPVPQLSPEDEGVFLWCGMHALTPHGERLVSPLTEGHQAMVSYFDGGEATEDASFLLYMNSLYNVSP